MRGNPRTGLGVEKRYGVDEKVLGSSSSWQVLVLSSASHGVGRYIILVVFKKPFGNVSQAGEGSKIAKEIT
jgi:hypothetical protein